MSKNNFQKIKDKLPGVKEKVLLKNYTTYKIGGPAKYFFIAKTLGRSPLGRSPTGEPADEAKEGLMLALKLAKENKLPVFILGGGSNLLISDKGFDGLVIKIDIPDIKFEGSEVFVGAGANLTKLAYLLANSGLSGLEWSAGVPGTVGGAIYGNAQAFGTKISDAVKSVEAINLKTFKIKSFTKKQCRFSLKSSIFKENKYLVIISAVLELRKSSTRPGLVDKQEIKNKIKEFLKYRKNNHPINFPSAGSTFVNPEVIIKSKKLLEKFTELNECNKKGVVPAGYLIAKCGLAGKKIGNAQISEKHANFIINLGGAKAEDVLSLMKLAKQKVKKTFGINLESEVQLVGFKATI